MHALGKRSISGSDGAGGERRLALPKRWGRYWAIAIVALAVTLGSAVRAQDYILGPEDVLQVTVARHPELGVDSGLVMLDGTVTVPRCGPIKVTGMTLAQAQEAIAKALTKVLVSPEVTVSLRTPRPNKVHVLGQVAKSGAFDLKPGWRLLDLLVEAGGLVVKSPELARATLHHQDGTSESVDLVALMVRRDQAANLTLRPFDVLYVQDAPSTRILIAGQGVKSQGPFELQEGQGVAEALAMAGGLTIKPERARATVHHKDGTSEQVDLLAMQRDARANLVLRPDDILEVQEVTTTRVFLMGPGLKSAGPVEVTEGMSLAQVIATAGGPTQNAALRKAVLIRPARDTPSTEEIPVDLASLTTSDPSKPKIQLQAGDLFVVRRARQGLPPLEVTVDPKVALGSGSTSGSIKLGPGDSLFIRRVRPPQQRQEIPIDLYDVVTKGKSLEGIKLEDGDTLMVPELTAKVSVFGLVKSPGPIRIPESEQFGVADAIVQAGGAAPKASLKKVMVVRPNPVTGQAQSLTADVESYFRKGDLRQNLALQDGDIVWVPGSGRIDFFGEVLPKATSLLLLPFYFLRVF